MSDLEEDDEMADLFSFSMASPVKDDKAVGKGADKSQDKSLLQKDTRLSDLTIPDTTNDRNLGGGDGTKDGVANDTVKPTGDKDTKVESSKSSLVVEEEDLFGPKPPSVGRHRTATSDSVLGLLDQEEEADMVVLSSPKTDGHMVNVDDVTDAPIQSSDTQEILDWLDETTPPLKPQEEEKEETQPTMVEVPSSDPPEGGDDDKDEATSPENEDDPPDKDDESQRPPDPPELGNPFLTLEDAIASPNSTMDQIRRLFIKEKFRLRPDMRPQLWCRSVCGKPLEQILESSNADSYLKWNKEFSQDDKCHNVNQRVHEWILKESSILAYRIVAALDDNSNKQQQGDQQDDSSMTLDQAKKELTSLLLFHYQSSNVGSKKDDDAEVELDPLLPPVACALLSAGIPTAAASVMLANIVPSFMPLLALANKERLEASKPLHTQFYLLASYHLPLLVHHLDRYVPGWHWPKTTTQQTDENDEKQQEDNATQRGRNLEAHGIVPQSWLISHLAGECDGTLMNPKWLVSLWDLILISNNNSLRFFFSLALLEKNSDTLLMVTGDTLSAELKRIMEFKEGTTLEGFAIEPEEDASNQEAVDWVQEWCDRARNLWESTPKSVTLCLRAAEDQAVSSALVRRQQAKEEALQARLDLEAKEHAQAVQAEKDRKMDAARAKLTRARLVAYYRKHNPEKEDRVDKILKTFEGRLEVLDAKLKKKYGVGFNPALKPKPPTKEKNKLLSSMNQSISVTRRRMAEALASKRNVDYETVMSSFDTNHHEVTVTVSSAEVLPVVCWSKESGAANRGKRVMLQRQQRENEEEEERIPIKFYLVDSRPAETCQEQGRFPTAVNLCPETLLDPDRIQEHEDMFESLRGFVHICVMGEGFSSVPELYGQKVNSKLQELINEDESRTNLCALFFVKKGFPFVSILEGGFAASHAWLAREGPKRFLEPSTALVDYNEDVSLFAQLEAAFREQEAIANATTRERTQHAMQNLFDGSLASLTKSQKRLEKLASDIEREKVRQSVSNIFSKKSPKKNERQTGESGKRPSMASVSKIFNKKQTEESKETKSADATGTVGRYEGYVESTNKGGGAESSRFRHNPFAGLAGSLKKDREEQGEVETKNNVDSGDTAGATTAAAARFRNPFAKKNDSDDNSSPALETTDAAQEKTESVLKNRLAKLKQTATSPRSSTEEQHTKDEAGGDKPEGPTSASSIPVGMKNRFVGLGSAFNNMATAAHVGAARSGTSTQPARNPFARFGGANKQAETSATAGKSDDTATNRFANLGMNQLRKMRVHSKKNVQNPDIPADDVVVVESTEASEESISFHDDGDEDVEIVDM